MNCCTVLLQCFYIRLTILIRNLIHCHYVSRSWLSTGRTKWCEAPFLCNFIMTVFITLIGSYGKEKTWPSTKHLILVTPLCKFYAWPVLNTRSHTLKTKNSDIYWNMYELCMHMLRHLYVDKWIKTARSCGYLTPLDIVHCSKIYSWQIQQN
jgi:hypothetical protein